MSTPKFLLVFVLLFSLFVLEGLGSSGEYVATSAISQAEEVVVSAYESILLAEHAGRNISALLAGLNEAGILLTEAQVAYRSGEFDEAVTLADLCSEMGNSIKGEADDLRIEAHGARVVDSWLTVTSSLASVIAVAFGSYWIWRVFKRHYFRRVLRMKPEVAKDES